MEIDAELVGAAYQTLYAGFVFWKGLAESTAALLDRSDQPEPLYAACRLCNKRIRIDRIDLAHQHFLTCEGA